LRRDRTPDDPLVRAKRRFHGLNQWPGGLPGFRETALAYMRRPAPPSHGVQSAGVDVAEADLL
jgi:isopenicillin N synthase-like dioxygenase